MKYSILFLFLFVNFALRSYCQCKLKYVVLYKTELSPEIGGDLENISRIGWQEKLNTNLYGGVSYAMYFSKIGISLSTKINTSKYLTNTIFKNLPPKYFTNPGDTNKVGEFGLTFFRFPLTFYFKPNNRIDIGIGIQYDYLVINDKQRLLLNDRQVFNTSTTELNFTVEYFLLPNVKITSSYFSGLNSINKINDLTTWKGSNFLLGIKYSIIKKCRWTVPSWLVGWLVG